jgi:hypothetical protein
MPEVASRLTANNKNAQAGTDLPVSAGTYISDTSSDMKSDASDTKSPLGGKVKGRSSKKNKIISQPKFSFYPGNPGLLGTADKNRLQKVIGRLRDGWGCPNKALNPIKAIIESRFNTNNEGADPLVVNDLLTCRGRATNYWNDAGYQTFSAGAERASDVTVWTPDVTSVSVALCLRARWLKHTSACAETVLKILFNFYF